MKYVLFGILIPALSGFLTHLAGISYFDSDTVAMAIAINVPVIALSSSILWATSD